jgi:hypothetical protein
VTEEEKKRVLRTQVAGQMRQGMLDNGINIFALDLLVESVGPDDPMPVELPDGWKLHLGEDTESRVLDEEHDKVRADKREVGWSMVEESRPRLMVMAVAFLTNHDRYGVPFIHPRGGEWWIEPPAQ